MRYFVQISYLGTAYVGWQRQINGLSIQEVIETSLSKIHKTEIAIVGCGRTDAGVHASQYFFHFDIEKEISDQGWDSLRRILPKGIAYVSHKLVAEKSHARFDAVSRSYIYRIHTHKEPFLQGLSSQIRRPEHYDQALMHEAAALLLDYLEFETFCKTKTDTIGRRCDLSKSEWRFEEHSWTYEISSNRFLRGMVRLIVGMCLQVGQGKISLSEVRHAMDEQIHLKKALSAPAVGLYLCAVEYPYEVVV